MSRSKEASAIPRFKLGEKVRIKSGVSDPDFPDVPLGGWSGTITEIIERKGQVNCVFELDKRTLAGIHPIYTQRCEIDGLDYKFMGLGQEEIELDNGTPRAIEQPNAIVARPLSPDDQDDRVRMVFGLTHDDFVPEVNRNNLHAYYRYLLAQLTLPFRAKYRRQTGLHSSKPLRLTVTGPEDVGQYAVEKGYGLIGLGKEPGRSVEFPLKDIEGIQDQANDTLIGDYCYWLANNG